MNILVTGGAGFIGSALIRYLIEHTENTIINVDSLTYAGNLKAIESISHNKRYHFEQVDICNAEAMERVFSTHQPDCVMHLAAETHVDRSIESPSPFIQSNIIGTWVLLETARSWWQSLMVEKKSTFRFHHISTDEVYGDLVQTDDFFTENTAYSPNSPYSASKASSDHLVRAWYRTYDLPILITNCSNNYGPYQVPEKFIPVVILNALAGNPIPVYGHGLQIRDWIYVDDHVKALYTVLQKGIVGETYLIGAHNEKQNIDVVHTICALLEKLRPNKSAGLDCYSDLITYVNDRPGHDQRYAVDASKIQHTLHWNPLESFESGLQKTILWYMNYADPLSLSNPYYSTLPDIPNPRKTLL